MQEEMPMVRIFGLIAAIGAIFMVQWLWGQLWDWWRIRRDNRLFESSYAGRVISESFIKSPDWMEEGDAERKAVAFEKWLLGLYEIAQDSETRDEYFQRSRAYLEMDKICSPQYHEFRLAMQGKVWNTHAENGPNEVHESIRSYARSAVGLT